MTLITTNEELKDFCAGLKKAPFITVDTEFMRERTFWPKLCLVQVAGPDSSAAIDPLAEGLDLAPFFRVLADENIIKVLHGGRQDIEIFYKLTGEIPAPVFDTQIAGMVCGFGDQVAYDTLVQKLLDQKIDKTSRFTDWSNRPLSKKQIDYAMADVIYLRDIYEKLEKRIRKFDRFHWLDEEMQILTSPLTYENRPEDAWRRIKTHTHKRRMLGILQEIAAWREREAQRLDVPRGRIIRDEAMAEMAAHPPTTPEDLARIRSISKGFAENQQGHSLLEAIKHGMNKPESECPERPPRPNLPTGLGPVIDLLRVLLKLKCEENLVATKLVASASDLELIAADDNAGVPALSGWRREIFGEPALALKHGKIALKVQRKNIEVIEVS